MRFQFLPGLAAVSGALALAACATTQAPPATVAWRAPPPPYAPSASGSVRPATPEHAEAGDHGVNPAFARLAGWADDDHAAALAAFQQSCGATQDLALKDVCRRAVALGRCDERQARRFLEANFRPEASPEEGLLTAYFAPVYEARNMPEGDFTAPVRPRPDDLPTADWTSGVGAPYADRSEIETRPAPDALAWMKPEDLFFLQIQGSGVLVYPNGVRVKALFDGVNGAKFRGIATPMRDQGLITDTSGDSIRQWLAGHAGPDAKGVMDLNPRYVFFKLGPDDGQDPAGAAGMPLIPGRAVAVDTSRHALGELVWIDATAPTLPGAFPSYRRLTVALDTGGAIKGDARADLYLGRGPEAGIAAGRVRHTLRLYRLVPIEPQSF